MKPKLKTYVIEFWDCGIDGHHHRNESTAQKCLDSQSASRSFTFRKKRVYRKRLELFKAIIAGESVKGVAARENKTIGGITYIFYNTARRLKHRYNRYETSMREIKGKKSAWLKAVNAEIKRIDKGIKDE